MLETASIGFATAFVAGVVSFLSPCVLPLVPGYVSYVAGTSLEDLRDRSASRLRAVGYAAQAFMRTVSKVVGGEVLTDAIAFFQAFDGMEAGFRQRAERVLELLNAPDTAYVLVNVTTALQGSGQTIGRLF